MKTCAKLSRLGGPRTVTRENLRQAFTPRRRAHRVRTPRRSPVAAQALRSAGRRAKRGWGPRTPQKRGARRFGPLAGGWVVVVVRAAATAQYRGDQDQRQRRTALRAPAALGMRQVSRASHTRCRVARREQNLLHVLRAVKSWRKSHALSCGCWPAQVVASAPVSDERQVFTLLFARYVGGVVVEVDGGMAGRTVEPGVSLIRPMVQVYVAAPHHSRLCIASTRSDPAYSCTIPPCISDCYKLWCCQCPRQPQPTALESARKCPHLLQLVACCRYILFSHTAVVESRRVSCTWLHTRFLGTSGGSGGFPSGHAGPMCGAGARGGAAPEREDRCFGPLWGHLAGPS